jgi:hypothetical protein
VLRRAFILSLLLGLSAGLALAQPAPRGFFERDRLINEDLRDQVAADDARILPRGESYTLALDSHFFYRSYRFSASPALYHGGFWIAPFLEYRPTASVAFNFKVPVFNPAYSYGVVSTTRVHPFVGFTWSRRYPVERIEALPEWNARRFLDWDLKLRLFDLDRQTLGAGLTLEEKEMSGLEFLARKDIYRFRFIQDGTGGYTIAGDLQYAQLDVLDDLLGVSVMHTHVAGTAIPTLYSAHQLWQHYLYRAEFSSVGASRAWMVGLQYRRRWALPFAGLAFRLKGQHRDYGEGWANHLFNGIESAAFSFGGTPSSPTTATVEPDYLSVEQEDKPFTNSQNVFVGGLAAHVDSLELELQLEPWDGWVFFSQNEVSRFEYSGAASRNDYFYRQGLRLYVNDNGNEAIEFVYSNKSIDAQDMPDASDGFTRTEFRDAPFYGVDGRLRF